MADRVLLTGISGFLGGHVALALLTAGYVVRGSVRDLRKAEKVRTTLAKAGADVSRLEFVALDLTSDAGWDDAMAGVRYLQHTASPFVTEMPADKMELVTPAVDGTRRALEAALRAKVERMVLTSSTAAIMYGHDKARTAPFTAADWTDLEGRDVNAYVETKTRAERAAWAIVDKVGRHDDLATINPGAIFGPLLDEDPGTSVGLFIRLFDGSLPAAARISFTIIDVRDVASAHVAAMTTPSAGGKRWPVGNGNLSLKQMADILRPKLPGYGKKLPRYEVPDWLVRLVGFVDKDVRSNLGELGLVKRLAAPETEALIGRPFIPAEDTLVNTAKSLIAHGLITS